MPEPPAIARPADLNEDSADVSSLNMTDFTRGRLAGPDSKSVYMATYDAGPSSGDAAVLNSQDRVPEAKSEDKTVVINAEDRAMVINADGNVVINSRSGAVAISAPVDTALVDTEEKAAVTSSRDNTETMVVFSHSHGCDE